MIHVPSGTFLSEYMAYMEDLECPRIYDLTTGLWILSNVLGRTVVVDRPRAEVYLNVFVILVSESGIMRKSSSIRTATTLLRNFTKQSFLENRATSKEINIELHRQTLDHGSASLAIVASELASAFGRGSGTRNTVALLTDLYDCPDARDATPDARTGVAYSYRRVFVSMLAGSTPSWLERTVTPTIIEGGFTSRCYFVVGRQRKRLVAWPERAAKDIEQLVSKLKEIKDDARARIGITNSAKDTFETWYRQRTFHNDPYRSSFESREDSHVLRLAGLFASNERAWIINDDHIRRAIDLTSTFKDFGTSLFSAGSVRTTDIAWIKRVRDVLLERSEGITRMDLSRSVNARGMRTHELQSLLHVMHELDLIEVYEESYQGQSGRPKTIYKPTIYLSNEGFMEEIIDKLGIDQGNLSN